MPLNSAAAAAAAMGNVGMQSLGPSGYPAAAAGGGGAKWAPPSAAELHAMVNPYLLDPSVHEELDRSGSQLEDIEARLHWLDWCLSYYVVGMLTWWQAAQIIVGLRPYPPLFTVWLRRLSARTSMQLTFSLWPASMDS